MSRSRLRRYRIVRASGPKLGANRAHARARLPTSSSGPRGTRRPDLRSGSGRRAVEIRELRGSVRRLRGAEQPPVADAGVGDDDAGPSRVLLDLAPKLADEHAQHVDVTFIAIPPHPVEEPAVREELARMLGARLDQRPLRLRQVDLRAATGDGVAREVDREIAVVETEWPGCSLAPRPAQKRPHPGHQLV